MAKYIDAKKLKAEIKRQKHELELSIQSQGDYGQSCHIVAYDNILSLIDSLQQEQPKIDLGVRKQIEELANDWHHKGFASDEDCPLCMQDLMDILWHFYELGQRKAAEMYDEIEYNRQRAEEEILDKSLDEAAERFANTQNKNFLNPEIVKNIFIAGAEWMAGQGVTKEAVIGMATKDIEINVSQRTLDALGLGPGDKVIVQIRKREESK